jgi:hypothetical protein|uniref:SAP domain-containing protein n=1 Tax=viral metagenome TaxID=1070528 RepID=A0A6C0J1Z7_9ZZZZ
MSFNKKVTDFVENTIKEYISVINDKYDIDPNELYNIWLASTGSSFPITTKLSSIPKATDEIDHNHLLSCKVPELKAMCKQRKLKCSGTKSELISLLLGVNKDSLQSPEPKKSPTKKSSVSKKVETESPAIKKVTSTLTTIPIRRNQFNNYEHPETSMVFDIKTKKVVGKQQDDGSVSSLTSEDIENCKKFKFEYVIPENLDSKTGLDDEKIDELEEEEDEFIESEEDIEEEELIEDEELDDNDFNDDMVYED